MLLRLLCLLCFFTLFFSSVFPSNLLAMEESLRPKWVNDPYSDDSPCQKKVQLCAIGTGTGRMIAQSNARRELALIFESKISGSKNFSKASSQSTDESGAITRAGSGEYAFSEVKESTEQILNGVEIIATFDDKDGAYALASLDRSKASLDLKERMKKIDEVMQGLLQDHQEKGRGVYNKLVRQYKIREGLNAQFQVINEGLRFPEAVTWATVQSKREVKKTEITLKLKGDLFDRLRPAITQLLNENDYAIAKGVENNATIVLDGVLTAEEQYLKVEGFKRYKFTLDLFFLNSEGKKIFTTSKEIMEDGRTMEDIRDKALKQISDFLKEEWKDISIN